MSTIIFIILSTLLLYKLKRTISIYIIFEKSKIYITSIKKLRYLSSDLNKNKIIFNEISNQGTNLLLNISLFMIPYILLLTFSVLTTKYTFISLIISTIPYFIIHLFT